VETGRKPREKDDADVTRDSGNQQRVRATVGVAADLAAGRSPAAPPERPLPLLDELNKDYWCGGADGQLRIYRCRSCGYYQHPPSPVCSRCYGRDVGAEPVSGRGVVYSYTINEQPWLPALPPPYVVALVELDEQDGLRVVSNIVDCDIGAVRIGLAVTVAFVAQSDVHLPVFRPVDIPGSGGRG
jgi:uncharacterized OB-fold protein